MDLRMTHRLFDDPQLLLAETRALRQLAGQLVADPAAADDLVQDTWLTALSGRRQAAQDEGWLRGVLRNLLRQEQRGQRRRSSRERAAARSERLAGGGDHLERLEALQAVVSAVRGLPEPYRGMVMARFFEERQPKEIAESLGIPLATLRTRLHRALQMLRESLDRRFGGESQDWRRSLMLVTAAETLIPPIVMSGKLKLACVAVVAIGLVWTGAEFLLPEGEELPVPSVVEASPPAIALQEQVAAEEASESPEESIPGRAELSEPVDAEIRVPPGTMAVTGWVRDDGGQAIAGARIWTVNKETRSTADGSYRIFLRTNRTVGFLHAGAEGHANTREIFEPKDEGSVVKMDFALRKEFRIRGRVVDLDGRPVEDVEVDTFYNVGEAVKTDEKGQYLLAGLDPGRPEHSLSALKAGYIRSNAEVRTLADEVEQDLVLDRGNSVEGVVVDGSGNPIVGAGIYIGFDPNAYDRLDAKSDAEGYFHFPAVRPGNRSMVVQHSGHAAQSQLIQVPTRPEALELLEVVLTRGRSIAGRVLDENDQPVSSASLSAQHQGKWIENSVTSDAEGRFEIEHLPEKDLSFSVSRRGFLYVSGHEVGDGESRTEIRMQRAGKIVGRVLDGRSHVPVEDFTIRFVDPELAEGESRLYGYGATWAREGHKFSAKDGRWSTGNERLKPGAVVGLEIAAEGFATTRVARVTVSADEDPEPVVVELLPGTRVFGTVTAADLPVAGARITVLRNTSVLREDFSDQTHDRILTHSASDGTFEIRNRAAGQIYLAVEHEANAFAVHGPIQLAPGQQESEERIELATGRSIRGRIHNATGQVRSAVEVVLTSEQVPGLSNRVWRTTSDSDGRFAFDHLGAGSYRLRDSYRLGKREGWTVDQALRLESFDLTNLVLSPGTERGEILGQIESDIEIIDPLQVSLRGPLRLQQVVTDGSFRFRHLPAGKYELSVQHMISRKRYSGKLEVELASDGRETVTLGIRPR